MTPLLLLLVAAPDLGQAIAAEREALLDEKRALEARAQEIRVERDAAKRENLAEITGLASNLESLRAELETLEAERKAIHASKARAAPADYEAILREAREILGRPVPSAKDDDALSRLFETAAEVVEASGRVQRGEGTFFGASGHATKGTIVSAGSLAAFGRADDVEGPLVRLEGEWSLAERADVEAVFGAPGSDVVPLVLTDSPHEHEEPTLGDRIDAGGALAWPIVSLAGVVLLVLLSRLLVLRRETAGDAALEVDLSKALAAGEIDRVQQTIADRDTGVARLTRVALAHRHLGATERSEIVESALVMEVAAAERWLSLLKLIAAVAPLLGLLGTVMGMIETFDVISVYGSGDPARLSGGISKALVTTELGLLVAVPTLFVHGALSSWVDRIADRLERVARDFPALLVEVRSDD